MLRGLDFTLQVPYYSRLLQRVRFFWLAATVSADYLHSARLLPPSTSASHMQRWRVAAAATHRSARSAATPNAVLFEFLSVISRSRCNLRGTRPPSIALSANIFTRLCILQVLQNRARLIMEDHGDEHSLDDEDDGSTRANTPGPPISNRNCRAIRNARN